MKILVVVDMQNDFVYDVLGTPEARAIVPNVKARIESGEFEKIFFTKDTHDKNYMNTLEGQKLPAPHCIKSTKGHNIIPELNTDNSTIIEKPTFGSCDLIKHIKDLNDQQEEINEVEICGLCTDICVISNCLMIRAALPNTKVVVRANCCAGVTPEKHEAALMVMESCQVDVIK